jgi:hypothetical protein
MSSVLLAEERLKRRGIKNPHGLLITRSEMSDSFCFPALKGGFIDAISALQPLSRKSPVMKRPRRQDWRTFSTLFGLTPKDLCVISDVITS